MTSDTGFPADSDGVPVRTKGRMTWKKWLAIGVGAVVVLAGIGVGTFLLLRPSGNTNRTFSQDVQATLGDQTLTVSFDGTLAPQKESDVNFAVSGTVTKVYVKAGDKVSKGQKLARIDDTDLRNAVDLANANLTTAQANLEEVYDDSGSSAAVTSAKAQVNSATAALTSAKEDLKNAVLRAPVDGTVASVSIEVGDTTGSGSGGSNGSGASGSGSSGTSASSASSAQVVVISANKWKVSGSVGASDLASLKAGQSASVTTDASTDALTGKVTSVGIVATSTSSDGTATFPVEVTLSGTHTGLYSGTTATAVITTGSYDNVLTVPTAAIASSNGQTVVTKVTGTTTTVTPVEVGTVFGAYTQIKSGLSEGDTVRISFTRPSSTSTSGSNGGGFGGGGFGGGGFGGGGFGDAPVGGGVPGGARGGR